MKLLISQAQAPGGKRSSIYQTIKSNYLEVPAAVEHIAAGDILVVAGEDNLEAAAGPAEVGAGYCHHLPDPSCR